jgi:ABC-type sugar transport system ATPase subunit
VSPPALEVSGLGVPFGPGPGLAGVSFQVGAGERLVVVGGSGAGKTTLLRALAGLSPVQSGQIRIGGRDVTADPPERRDAVYLHQTPLLFPHLSVAENVAFPLRVRQTPAREVVARVQAALAAVQLAPLAARAPRTLSGGQRHRVALARAVVHRPAVLLLDEPLSALDPALRDDVRGSLLALQRAYLPAIVLVTHDLDEAGLVGERIAVLLDGGIAQIDTPARLFARPVSIAVARFLGIRNAVPGIVRPGPAFDSALGCLDLDGISEPPSPGPCVAVFRPDAARLTTDLGACPACVTGIRHGSRSSTVEVAIGGTLLEIAAPLPLPQVGTPVSVTIDPGICTFLKA